MKTRKSRGLLASYSQRRRTGRLGRVPGTEANPLRNGVTEGAPLLRRQKLLQRARGCSLGFGRLKYSMASRSRLSMQISSDESHVPAPGLILYPDSRSSISPLPSSHFLCRALSIYFPRPLSLDVLCLSMALVST